MPKNRDYTGLLRTPPAMAWLIRERATLKGKLDSIDKELEELSRQRVELAQALRALDQVIPLHEVKVDPQAIVGLRHKRPALLPYGTLTRSILECLRQAARPMRTYEIAYYVARVSNLDIDAVGRTELAHRVSKRLDALRVQGLLVAYHDQFKGANKEGIWAIRADEEVRAA